MAKKKPLTKKHSFKHATPHAEGVATIPQPQLTPATANHTTTAVQGNNGVAPASTSLKRSSGVPVVSRDFAYVGRDLRRLSILASCLLLTEVALWLILDFTQVGRSIYGIITF